VVELRFCCFAGTAGVYVDYDVSSFVASLLHVKHTVPQSFSHVLEGVVINYVPPLDVPLSPVNYRN
jgi:hypothetical protein